MLTDPQFTELPSVGQDFVPLGYQVISGRDLTHAHYSYASIHSNAVVVKKVKHQKKSKPPKHVRGVITRFSPRSRVRMMRKTGQIRGLARPYFLSLTYPGEFEVSPNRVKAHLFALRKRIVRRFPHAGIIWRLELKKRKSGLSEGEIVPHYHMVLWGMKVYPSSMYAIINRMWWEIVWTEYEDMPLKMPLKSKMTIEQRDHAEHGVDVKLLPDFRAVLAYVSKYAAKTEDDETGEHWGRRWGVCGRVDISKSIHWGLTWDEHIRFRRGLRKLLEKRKSAYAWWLKSGYPSLGFTVLGSGDDDDPETVILSDIFALLASVKNYENPRRIIDKRHETP